jgi:L-aspartate oxidase
MNNYTFDYVIIGTGLAGLYSALNASKFGTVALITKTTLKVSNSYLAQGGIAAAIGESDSSALHIDDTLKAGRGLCNNDAVDVLINDGKEIIQSLIDLGMPFDTDDGKISFGLEGGHSIRRVLHAGGDSTGRELVDFILTLVLKEKKIKFFENILVYDLIKENDDCIGIRCFDLNKQTSFGIAGNCTIIASGGTSAIYSRTTNPPSSVGEGITLAYNAGAEIESMEFLQFHPTAFYSERGNSFLISEAVRGDGAYLVNHQGNRFLYEWNANELSPRDIVSAAIYHEMKRSGIPNVFLKLDHLEQAVIKKRFSTIYAEVMKNQIDITKDLIPIAPAAHYMIGGIKTGLCGETNIERLYAVGEVASTGVHGANRLASNSLLECLVFSKRAVEHANSKYISFQKPIGIIQTITIDGASREILKSNRKKIGQIMWDNVGIVRDKASLENALYELKRIQNNIGNNNHEYYHHQIRGIIEVAEMITRSAILREESRGSHNRLDFTKEDSLFLKTIIFRKGEEPYFHKLKITGDRKCG